MHMANGVGAAGSVSMFGYTLVVGAPNDVDGGSFHFYDLEYQRMMIPTDSTRFMRGKTRVFHSLR